MTVASPSRSQRPIAAAWLASVACLVVGAAGCASLPTDPAVRSAYVDLRKSVELSEDTGWVIDRIQLDSNLEGALRSVCQTTEESAQALDRWLTARVDDEGGPAELQFLEHGVEVDDLGEVLTLERTRALLEAARGRRGDCPFWLAPDPGFGGVENNASRTTLWLESQGFGAIIIEGDAEALAGGGGARLLVAHGFWPRASLAVGAEVGGSGTLDPGDASGRVDTSIHVAVPMMLRLFDVSRVFDFTVAPVFQFDQGRSSVPPGLRATIGGGFSTTRRGDFMPYVVVWLGYEGHGLASSDPVSHSLRIGTRVGFDWDPGGK